MVSDFRAVQEDHGTRQALPDFSGCVGSVVTHNCAARAEESASLPGPKSSSTLILWILVCGPGGCVVYGRLSSGEICTVPQGMKKREPGHGSLHI